MGFGFWKSFFRQDYAPIHSAVSNKVVVFAVSKQKANPDSIVVPPLPACIVSKSPCPRFPDGCA